MSDTDGLEKRVRETETAVVLLAENLKAINSSVNTMQRQVDRFIERSQEILIFANDLTSAHKKIDHLTGEHEKRNREFVNLRAEHDNCPICHGKEGGLFSTQWWGERITRMMDWSVPGIVLWFLYLYKMG